MGWRAPDLLASLPARRVRRALVTEDDLAPSGRCGSVRVYDHMARLVTLERSGCSPTFFSGVTTVNMREGEPYYGPPRSRSPSRPPC